jgi:hypothetical protein
MRHVSCPVLLVVLFAAAAPAAAAGLYWEIETSGAGETTQTGRVHAVPKKMKISQNPTQSIVLRGDEDEMIGLDHERKTYWQASMVQLEAISKRMREEMESALRRMEKQKADLPAAQRAQVEKMLADLERGKGGQPSAVEITVTGRRRTIGGYACTEVVATERGRRVLTAWTTDDVEGFDSIRDDWMRFQQRMVETSRAFNSPATDAYSQLRGFPMETEMDGVRTVVTRIEAREIPDSEFAPPPDYTRETPEFLR